ncbi:hypothetical protein BB561_004569, partial [Smittium simulii]
MLAKPKAEYKNKPVELSKAILLVLYFEIYRDLLQAHEFYNRDLLQAHEFYNRDLLQAH